MGNHLDFKAVFDSVDSALLILDTQFNMVAVNETRVKATGVSAEDCIGRNIFEMFPDDPSDPGANGVANLKASLNRVLKTRAPDRMAIQKYNIPIRSSTTGEFEERYWSPINIPVLDSSGNVTHILHRVEDVTAQVKSDQQINEHVAARKIIEKSESEAREIANCLPIIVYTATPDAHVDWYNDWWYSYLGLPVGTTWDCAITQPMHPEDVAKTKVLWPEAVRNGKEFRMEQRFRRGSDGEYRWHLCRAMPIFDENGQVKKYIGGNTDIHDVKMLTEELQGARVIADRANETKTAFLANMSHEIRTPLTAILGFSNLLKDRTIATTEKDQYVDTIVRNGNSLTRIIDDILDLAKVEAGKLDVESMPFSLYDLATDAVDLFKDKTKEKGIYLLLNIDDDVPPEICSDPTRLRQILINLIGNAVKFTDHGGVRVSVRATPFDDGKYQLTVDVKDTGIGLTPEQKARLFQPFSQADNSMTRKFGGTGLGLVLSQRLSHALRGEISIVDTGQSEGSTFRLSFVSNLPLHTAKPNIATGARLKGESVSLEGLRILVVDDSEDNQFLVSRLLSKRGAAIETAADGQEGFHKALAGSYDVVLMDLQMPRMDGYQAKRALDERGFNKPVIALTAHAMSDERDKTKHAGFAGHLTKPLITEELVTTVARFAR